MALYAACQRHMMVESRRRNVEQSKQTDPKTRDGRQANIITNSRRLMRQSNRHIASMAACYVPCLL